MRCKRLLCLLLTVLMLCSLVPETTLADTTVYFTAVNDQLLSLSDDTMPFWSGGRLYFPAPPSPARTSVSFIPAAATSRPPLCIARAARSRSILRAAQ